MTHEARAQRRALGAAWLFGLLVLAAVISTVVARGEITGVTRALRQVRISWLLAGIGLQAVTYVLAAGIWRVALARQGERRSLATLVPLALAMLFSNQAVPSVGLSGGLIVQEALARRGTPRPVAMAALLMGLITTYGALVIALAAAVLWLGLRGAASLFTLTIAAVFTLMAGGVSVGILQAHRLASARRRLLGWPVVGPALAAASGVPANVLRAPGMLATLTAMHLAEILIDVATLGVSLRAIGVLGVRPGAVFCSYVMASAGSRVAFAPLGIGTFEAASVLMLHGRGVPLDAALAATLVFRGLTLWLPMVPGLWCARRALQ